MYVSQSEGKSRVDLHLLLAELSDLAALFVVVAPLPEVSVEVAQLLIQGTAMRKAQEKVGRRMFPRKPVLTRSPIVETPSLPKAPPVLS